MKKITTVIFSVLLAISGMGQTGNLNLMTYNIRFDNPDDSLNAWPNRKDKVAAMIRFYDADIVCVQEALHHQLLDMEERLPGFFFSGVGRDDGRQQGEYSAILFDTTKFHLTDEGSFWLSQTPELPSLGWDAACIRVCSWVRLKPVESEEVFFVFNTHFDHVGTAARENSAALIVAKIPEIAGNFPLILTGDFNAEPGDVVIQTISTKIHDTYHISEEPPYGPFGTWNAFDYTSPLDRRIDYVFVSSQIEVIKYGVLTDSDNHRFPSDHLPVLVRLAVR